MVARTQLAAIDNNHNTGRKQAVIQRGERVGEARYRPCFPKMHGRWVVKPVLEKKSYAFLPELQKKVRGMCNGTEDPLEETAVDLPRNIASGAAPGKQYTTTVSPFMIYDILKVEVFRMCLILKQILM